MKTSRPPTDQREDLLAILNKTAARSIHEVAQLLGCDVQDALAYKSYAGVNPLFRGADGTPYFSGPSVELIRKAKKKHGPIVWVRGTIPDDIEAELDPPSAEAVAINKICEETSSASRDVAHRFGQ
jgi:hypothetical protein